MTSGYQPAPGSAAWKLENVVRLPPRYVAECFKGKARVLDSNEVRGVTDGIDKLNRNIVYCPEDHCVIYSESNGQYCLLFRRTLDSTSAMSLLGIQGTQSTEPLRASQPTAQVYVAYQSAIGQADVACASGGEVEGEDEVEASEAKITIIDGTLARIFDSFCDYHKVYVKLQRVQPDGTTVLIGQTLAVEDRSKAPKWHENFKYKRVSFDHSKNTMRIGVYAEKKDWRIFKGDTLCGQADINLPALWQQVEDFKRKGHDGPIAQTLSLYKALEETGKLNISIEASQIKRSPTRQGTTSSMTSDFDTQASGTANIRLTAYEGFAAAPPCLTQDQRMLINRPEEMEEMARKIFLRLAQDFPDHGTTVKGLALADMDRLASALASKLKVNKHVFGDTEALFWRYNFSEYPILEERDAVSLMMSMVRRYRDATNPGTEIELGIPIKEVSERYDLGKELGRGGQAIVHIATQKDTGREVVLKMYARGNPDMPKEEITHEFQMLINLKHPKIARYYEIFEDAINFYIVSEPYFGGDLTGLPQTASAAGCQVTEEWLAKIAQQIAQGVSFLHSHQIMHCDLKEANVMVANKTDLSAPQVVLIDFGLANHLSSTTRGGGSPGYMPPEVWEQELWTPRGDVFSLGAIVYSLTFGQSPFLDGCRTIEDVRDKTLSLDVRMGFGSQNMRDIVDRMLARKHQDRPPIKSVLNCAWFQEQTGAQTQAIDTSALEKLAQKNKQNALRRALLADVASRENLAQLTKLNQLFIEMDTDNDGTLSVSEARSALKQNGWPDENIDKLLKALVGNKEEVPYEEFMVNMIGSTASEESALLERIFIEADKKRTGQLDVQDIKDLIERPAVAKVVGARDAESLLRDMDKNKDGFVSLDEFKWVMHGMPAQSDGADSAIPTQSSKPPVNSILLTQTVMKKKGPAFYKNQEIEYWSTSYNKWLPGVVTEYRAIDGSMQVSNKPGYWLIGQELKKVRLKS